MINNTKKLLLLFGIILAYVLFAGSIFTIAYCIYGNGNWILLALSFNVLIVSFAGGRWAEKEYDCYLWDIN